MESEAPPVLPPSGLPPVSPLPPAPRKSRTVLYVVLGLAGAALLGLLLLVGDGVLFMVTAQDEALSADDEAALLTVSVLAEWMEDYSPDLSKETLSKTRYLDRSYDVDYEFDDAGNDVAPYLMCSVTVEPKLSDALISYKAMQTGLNIGFGSQAGASQVERNDLFRWGDRSRFCILEADGTPVGNSFTAVKGKRVFMVTFSGVFFDDPVAIRDLLVPHLDALERLATP